MFRYTVDSNALSLCLGNRHCSEYSPICLCIPPGDLREYSCVAKGLIVRFNLLNCRCSFSVSRLGQDVEFDCIGC